MQNALSHILVPCEVTEFLRHQMQSQKNHYIFHIIQVNQSYLFYYPCCIIYIGLSVSMIILALVPFPYGSW